ncbi:MAG: UPF0262 family protein [Hyphomonas sp.]
MKDRNCWPSGWKAKVEVDFLTARRLFTLICALHAGQARAAG